MKTFALLVVALLVVSCGSVNDDTQSDTLPDEDMDIVMPVEENEMRDDEGNIDDWSMDDIEAEWEEARERSAELNFTWLTEDEASELASENNIPFRVVMRDDEMLPVTMDYRPGRINATLEDGIVTGFSIE